MVNAQKEGFYWTFCFLPHTSYFSLILRDTFHSEIFVTLWKVIFML
jgi:hypothetical protein